SPADCEVATRGSDASGPCGRREPSESRCGNGRRPAFVSTGVWVRLSKTHKDHPSCRVAWFVFTLRRPAADRKGVQVSFCLLLALHKCNIGATRGRFSLGRATGRRMTTGP